MAARSNVRNGSKADLSHECRKWVESGHLERRSFSRVFCAMVNHKTYDEATEVTAKDGQVILDGPDAVDVKVTPEAAEQTAYNLVEGAVIARGQRRLKDL